MEDKTTPDWKALELLVTMIQKQLSPNAVVKNDVRIEGVHSETKRQVDVLVEQNIGQYKMRIIIDCKDYSKPVDVKGVEEFQGLIEDVQAHKGALVCPSGFSKSALNRARKLKIDLFKPVSKDNKKWQPEVLVPILFDYRVGLLSIGMSCSSYKPLKIQNGFFNKSVYGERGNELGSPVDIAIAKWNNAELPSLPGENERVPLFKSQKVFVDNGYGDMVEIDFTVATFVEQTLYLNQLPIKNLDGLIDQQTGQVITNAFTVEGISPHQITQTWNKIENNNEIGTDPLLTIIGYECKEVLS